MIEYNKLVRDKIPDIIKTQGETPIIKILKDKEYIEELDKKLIEETNEYQQTKEIEELADILEVIYSISGARGYSQNDLLEIYQQKHEKRGGFSKKIFLIGKDKNKV